MTSPGGTEVGRASIRVLPDVSGFRQRLRAELAAIGNTDLKVNVDFDIDPAELQAQLRRLDNKLIVRVRLLVDDPDIKDTVTISARLNIDLAYWRAQVARINPVRLRANVDVDIDEGEIARRVRRAIRRGGTDVDVNGRGGNEGFGGVVNSFSLIAQFGGRWLRYLLQALAIAPLLVLAGAAISAAWGAVSAAIGAIPAALFLLAAPVATVLLGFEGIKASFAPLGSDIERIGAKVSAVFTKIFGEVTILGRTFPSVVSELRNVLGYLDADFERMAFFIGIVVREFTNMVNQGDRIAQIKEIFRLTTQATSSLGSSLVDILGTLIDVATISDGYDVLTSPIRAFADAFRESVSEIGNNGTLGGALGGLRIILDEVARGFVALVENGMYLFLGAAPGVQSFLYNLTKFFDRFDWETLGIAVGNVFDGLAAALRNVDQATIDDIVAAFDEIGNIFASQEFQLILTDIIKFIPGIIRLVGIMTQSFLRGLVVLGNLAKAALGILALVKDSVAALAGGWSLEEFEEINNKNWDQIFEGFSGAFRAAFDDADTVIDDRFTLTGDNIYHGFVRMDGRIQEGIQLVEGDKDFDPLSGLGEGLGLGPGVTLPFEEAAGNALIGKEKFLDSITINGGELTRLRGSYDGVWGVVGLDEGRAAQIGENAQGLARRVLDALAPPPASQEVVGNAWSTVAEGINGAALRAVDTANATLSTGFTRSAQIAGTGAAQVGSATDSGLETLQQAVARAMVGARGAFDTGWSASFVSTDQGARRVVSRTAQLPGQIQNSLGSGSGLLNNAGQNIMNSLYNGLVAAYGKVQRFVGGIANWIARNKGPESVDRRLLQPAGQWIMEGLAEGLDRGFTDVMTQVRSMNAALQDSWTVNGGVFAAALTEGVPAAIASNERLLAKSNVAVGGDVTAAVSAEGFGVGDEIVSALEGWQVVIDANGITKLVNKTNTRKARR